MRTCEACGNRFIGVFCHRCGKKAQLMEVKIQDENEHVENLISRQLRENPAPLEASTKQTVVSKTELDPPSVADRVVGFSKSLVKHAKNGFSNVEDDLQRDRLRICKSCPFFNEENISCKKCGCYLLVKTAWASESCPEGKWGPIKSSKSLGGCGGCGGKKT